MSLPNDLAPLLGSVPMSDQGRPFIVEKNDTLLVTGASGFIGVRVVDALLARGFRRIRCLVRPSSNVTHLRATISQHGDSDVAIVPVNLLSRVDCRQAA